MTFFCLLEKYGSTATHLEALEAESRNAAIEAAVHMLSKHASASVAHVLSGDKIIATIADDRRIQSAMVGHP